MDILPARAFRLPAAALLAAAALAPDAARAAVTTDLGYVDTASSRYTRFKGFVDQAVAGSPGYEFKAIDAVYAWRLTNNAAYCNLAVQKAEAQVAAAEAEIAAGRRAPVAADSYLEVGSMIRDVAITFDWCAAFTTAAQRGRWAAYAEQAVWNVWNPSQARWGNTTFAWSGWSINDPGNNYHFSFLEATMYWALASNSAAWRNFLEQQKFPALQQYYANLPGGGSGEGTGYGLAQGRLFETYRIWRDGTGVDLSAANTHLDDTVDYWIHATVPTRDRVAPIGDQSRVSYPEIWDYHRNVVLQARAMAHDAGRRARAQWWLSSISIPQMTSGFNFRNDLLSPVAGGSVPTALFHHATGPGHFFARSDWTPNAMWLSFVAGRYNQSHAHKDQGAFTLFQGDFLAVTENVFSRSGIQQGSDVHNVVRFVSGGQTVLQREGTTSTMTVTPGSGGSVYVDANLTPSFAGNPAVTNWRRELTFANKQLRVRDTFAKGAGVEAIFQVNTPVQPVVNGRTAKAGNLTITVVSPADATLSVLDWRTVNASEFTRGYRLDVRGGGSEFVVDFSTADDVFSAGFE
jgi:hypothetical protein